MDSESRLRASGAAATRCLAEYTAAVEDCRSPPDAACEAGVRADGGTLDTTLARPEETDQHTCTQADLDALGYLSPGDVVLRTRNACG